MIAFHNPQTEPRMKRLALPAAALLVAAALGFGVARYTAGRPPAAPTQQEAVQPAEDKPRNALAMSAAAIRDAGILSEKVHGGGLDAEIIAQATVTPAPGGEALISARAGGTVIRLNKRLGDAVRPGEVLAVVESRDAAQIAADRSAAQAKVVLADRNLAREKLLFDEKVSARVDYERAEAEAAEARAEAKRAAATAAAANLAPDGAGVLLASPISGQVTMQMVSLGAFLQPETPAFRIADPRKIQIEAAVSPGDSSRLAAGDRAVIERADRTVSSAIVRTLTPSLDNQTRAVTVVLDLDGGSALPPGQAVRVRLLPSNGSKSQAVAIPEEAVQSIDGRDCVFVRTANGFEIRSVTMARRSAGRAEIASGLNAGDEIATKGAFLLKAELGKGAGDER